MTRKICVILTNRCHYSRSKYLLQAIKDDPELELQLVVGGSAVSDKYGSIIKKAMNDGFKVDSKIYMIIEGGTPLSMARTTGVGLIEFSSVIDNLNPDIVIVRGDRFETIAPAIATVYQNKTLAHIEGGDVSGNIDESVRHSITKLSHIHFTTNEDSKKRVIKLGEDEQFVYNVGSPDVEYIEKNCNHINRKPHHIFNDNYKVKGIGPKINVDEDYVVVMQHPVTSEYGNGAMQMTNIISAIKRLNMQAILFWPNMDAGNDEFSKIIRKFVTEESKERVHLFRNLDPNDFLSLVNHSKCLLGNSSTGIKECSFLGVPVVNVGTRQSGRLKSENVLDVSYDVEEIVKGVESQIKHGKYKGSTMYGEGDCSKRIMQILKSAPLLRQKKIKY
jgi:UDP-hydrolysing UDP-N-acetyl-D-glucosamine 2-epimerase